MTEMHTVRVKRIGRAVKAALSYSGHSQKDLEKLLDLSQGQISARVNGRVEFRVSELDKVARYLGRSYLDFTGERDPITGQMWSDEAETATSSGYKQSRVHRHGRRVRRGRILPGARPDLDRVVVPFRRTA